MAVAPRQPVTPSPENCRRDKKQGDTQPKREQREARRSAILGFALLLSGLLAFVVWQYLVPLNMFGMFFGLNPRAVAQFHSHLLPPFLVSLRFAAWALGFRCLLLILWAGYALIVVAGLRGFLLPTRHIIAVMTLFSLFFALFCPPLLTSDCYSYLGYAHLQVFHGLNPYTTTTAPLLAHHDPVVRFLYWTQPTVYGPVWTLLEIGVVRLFPSSLWLQITALKVVECLALWGAAFAGKTLAERFQPGRGTLTLLAIGLNPLLLIEGPGNGHNDIAMVSLALGAAVLFSRKRYGAAGLLLGLSVSIKIITLALLPWMTIVCLREKTGARRWIQVLSLTAMTCLPSLLGYIPFWHGAATFMGMQQRALFCVSPETLAENARLAQWLAGHGVHGRLVSLLTTVFQYRLLVLIYAGTVVWLWKTAKPGAWLTAWVVLAPCLMFFGMGMAFPWYIAWFWTVALVRWDRLGLGLSTAGFAVGLVWECCYSCYLPPP